MTPVDASARLAALLQAQAAAFRAPQQAPKQAPLRRARSAPPAASRQADLAGIVARRVAAIALDDPQRQRKAFRVFLESVLLHGLGEGLIHDPAFAQMVDAVDARMRADPELCAAAEALGVALANGEGAPAQDGSS